VTLAIRDETAPADDFFLPNFCGLRLVFGVVLLSELFAFVLTLARLAPRAEFWGELGMTSLFMQWAGLSGAAVLCALRRHLARLGDIPAALVSYLLLLLVVALLSEAAFQVARLTGIPLSEPIHAEFLLRNLAIGAIVSALALRYFYVQHQWRGRMHSEGQARLQALQARIRPHFLFNSLNTVAALIRSRPAVAEEAVEDLADLFRASLGDGRHLIPLREELELTRHYLHMEQLRLGERLRLDWDLELPEDLLLPPLTLQPLLENAVYHGIEPQPEGGAVTIRGRREGETATLEVSNPVPPGGQERRHGNRIAQENVRQRLYAHFGRAARLEAGRDGDRYTVRIALPCQRGTA
jgi:two-component system sensor histidine kinase AlgZ